MVPAELFRGSSGRTAKSRAVTRARRNFSAFLELTGRLTTNSVSRIDAMGLFSKDIQTMDDLFLEWLGGRLTMPITSDRESPAQNDR